MVLIAVDPGTEQAGVAVFSEGHLVEAHLIVEAGYTKEQRAWRAACQIGKRLVPNADLIVEYPQIYAKVSKVDPDDILALTLVVGGVLSLHGGGELVRPAQWKGQVPKKVMVNRILKNLSEEERKILKTVKDNHNVVDAVGVGLWKLKRLR